MDLKKAKEEIAISVVLILLSVVMVLVIVPKGVPLRASWGGDVGVNSRTFPYFASVSLGIIAFVMLLTAANNYRRLKKHPAEDTDSTSEEGERAHEKNWSKQAFFTFGLFLLYGALFVTIGYIGATIIVPAILLYYLGERKIAHYIGVYGFALLLYVIFQTVLKIRLP
jgi:preprotein translocase subunit SecG